jgi:DEAD/DEAH box helicase domain-containing protein
VRQSDELLNILTAGGRRADRLRHVHHIPAREGASGEWPDWVLPELLAGLEARGAGKPWLHQVQAASLAWSGTHVALATSTGSGKSLAYWVPALSAVRGTGADMSRIESVRDRGTVLYLSPTKALAQDQLHSVTQLLRESGMTDVAVDTCDGDTPFEARKWIQGHSDVILTNPDYVHYSMLPGHARWARFFKRLRYVIIDEGHAYRGVFGAHVALIMRRLRRIAQYYQGAGQGPTFIVASATTAEPARSVARLIGVEESRVAEVTQDTSPAGRKIFALWQPPVLVPFDNSGDPTSSDGFTRASQPDPFWDLGLTDAPLSTSPPSDDPWAMPTASPATQSADGFDALTGSSPIADDSPATSAAFVDEELTSGSTSDGRIFDAPPADEVRRAAAAEAADRQAVLAAHSARSLAFTRSRRAAESVATHAQEELAQVNPSLPGKVAAYRGGYLPEERRALETAIRTGDLLALSTTNALELGVDISGLDAVLIVGWPGTRVSVWQQAGRAGRAGAEGLVVFIAREDPLDTYLVHHPEAVFDAPIEATVFDPHNPYVLAGQLCTAAAELPLRPSELDMFGGSVALGLLDQLTERGTLRRRELGWYWTHEQNAADFTSIRGDGGRPVQVVERESGRLLGTVDSSSADGQVHNGAVYVHQGSTYIVAEYDLRDSVAFVDREAVAYTTWSRDVTSIEITSTLETTRWDVELPGTDSGSTPHVEWGFGNVDVHGQVVSYNRRRVPSGEILSNDPLDLPVRTLNTAAVWWSVSAELLEVAGLDMEEAPGALHAAEHASIGLLPLLATCDRWDLGGLSTSLHVDTERATVFVYDALAGGAGFAERGFGMAREWLTATLEAVKSCSCAAGCPACVQSPKCGNGNNPLSKDGAIRLLETVLFGQPQ